MRAIRLYYRAHGGSMLVEIKNLAKKYKVQRVPTILLFDGDEMVKSYSGIMPPQGILVDFLKGGDLHGTDRCN